MLETKINSGKFKGRILQLPPQSITRAMSGKVRAAIFNKLEVTGKSVQDLFAGGGTLGFEALSHGAASVTFVDVSSKATREISRNATSLGVESKVKIIKNSVEKFVTESDNKFDIVLADPPYADFNTILVKRVANLVQLGGILVLSCSSKTQFAVPSQCELITQKTYGDTKISYLRKTV